MHPAWLFNLASAAVLLTGSVLIPLNRWVWLGAGMLSVFLILTIAIVHTFWNMSAPNMQISLYFALEHITVIGGLWVTAIASRLRQRLANTRGCMMKRYLIIAVVLLAVSVVAGGGDKVPPRVKANEAAQRKRLVTGTRLVTVAMNRLNT